MELYREIMELELIAARLDLWTHIVTTMFFYLRPDLDLRCDLNIKILGMN